MKYVSRKQKFSDLAEKSGIDQKTIDKLIGWLDTMNFFNAPASTKYHGAYEGGLFDHSYEVATSLIELTEKLGLAWWSESSPFIVGMFHDLCKCDQYEYEDGKWVYKDSIIPGHGEKSVIFAQNLYPLTTEEIVCIRWHMGAFETDTKMWNLYGKAIEKYPNVLWTHTADMMAARIRGV